MAEMSVELAQGLSRSVHIEPGTMVLVRRGSVRLRQPPRWLAETWIQKELRLDADGCYVAASGGWVELTALEGAGVILIPDGHPGLLEKSAVAVRRLLHALCTPLRSMR